MCHNLGLGQGRTRRTFRWPFVLAEPNPIVDVPIEVLGRMLVFEDELVIGAEIAVERHAIALLAYLLNHALQLKVIPSTENVTVFVSKAIRFAKQSDCRLTNRLWPSYHLC